MSPRKLAPWIQTYSGIAFDPLEPNTSHIDLTDIAHALSLVNRYTGHTRDPYSVARHSLTVAYLVKIRGGSINAQMMALLHDASEAYIADIASPVKQSHIFAGYREAEAKLQRAIFAHFNVNTGDAAAIQRTAEADASMLFAEREKELPPGAWVLDAPAEADALEAWEWGKPFALPSAAEAGFIALFGGLDGSSKAPEQRAAQLADADTRLKDNASDLLTGMRRLLEIVRFPTQTPMNEWDDAEQFARAVIAKVEGRS